MNKDPRNATPHTDERYDEMTPVEKAFFERFKDHSPNGVVIHFDDHDMTSMDTIPHLFIEGTGKCILDALALIVMDLSKNAHVPAAILMGALTKTVREIDLRSSLEGILNSATSDPDSLFRALATALGGEDTDEDEESSQPSRRTEPDGSLSLHDMVKNFFGYPKN